MDRSYPSYLLYDALLQCISTKCELQYGSALNEIQWISLHGIVMQCGPSYNSAISGWLIHYSAVECNAVHRTMHFSASRRFDLFGV